MTDKELFTFFLKTKKELGLRTYDTHVHPFDVLGSHKIFQLKKNYGAHLPSHSLLERLEYNSFSLHLLAFIFRHAPFIVAQSIRNNFMDASESRLLFEMDGAGIDETILVPVEPFVGTHHIHKEYISPRFVHLGSINLHALQKKDIRWNIEMQIEKMGVAGFKLHPNIQSFFPHPSRNQRDVAEKLHAIYELAAEKKKYLLFHGGISHLLNVSRAKVEYGLLKNFFGERGEDDLFQYKVPTVIAHLGHYNIPELNMPLLKQVARYHNVYFETSGVGPRLIRHAVETIGSKKIVFGSDANYFRIKFNVILVLRALALAETGETLAEKIAHLFSKNFCERLSP